MRDLIDTTPSADPRNGRLIEKSKDTLMKDHTVFIISHWLATVRNASAILVLEDGKIIERGVHAGLLEQKGR